MKYRHFQKIVRVAVLALLVFVLATEPALVAAKSLQSDPQAQALDLALQGGDIYLDSVSNAVMESVELLGYVETVQSTPISQLNEAYIEDVIDRALSVAEKSSIALGAVDDLADGIEQIGEDFPLAMNVSGAMGIPDQLRTDLIAQGIPSTQVDQISTSMSDLYASRQAGIPTDVQASLLGYGFTQAQINDIADAVAQRGLVNTSMNTRLAQFRATQDELADSRSGMVTLAVQLLAYQIAVSQSNGIQPRAATTAELEQLAEDELRILIHTAHLNAMWDSDPSAEIGEGDWWFIEHFAERAADRLQTVIVETQNRGLVAELFILRQMKMLAVSARTGDADYAKAELDALSALLAHQLDATAYYQQHATPGFVEVALARVVATPSLRENVEWPVSSSAIKNARIASIVKIDSVGVQNLAESIGAFDESNETNNTGGMLIVAGLEIFDQLNLNIAQAGLQILSVATPENMMMWITAIMTGDTDNPALIAANVIFSLIPVIGVIPDIYSLATDPSMFVKALSIFGIIGSIGDLVALIPGLQGVGGASFVGDAVSVVVKNLFKQADNVFRAVLDGLKLTNAFDVVADLVKTVVKIVGNSLGDGLQAVINTITNIFTGSRSLWGDFVAFTRRAGSDMLLKLGFDQGSALVGRVLSLGVDLSDEALVGLKKVSDDLVAAGLDLSDEAAEGLGKFAKSMSPDDFQRFINKLGSVCSVGNIKSSAKLAIPLKRAGTICNPELAKKVMTSYQKFDDAMNKGAQNILEAIGPEGWGDLMLKYANDPDTVSDANSAAKQIFGKLGNAVDADAIKIAMSKGPEAVSAMSHWDEPLLKHSKEIAKELAERSGKDAAAIKILTEWNGNISTLDIDGIAKNSTVGSNTLFGLGGANPSVSPYIEGWVEFSRRKGANFYMTNPEVGALIRKLPEAERDAVFWAINKAAVDAPIAKRLDFVYQIDNNLNPKDLDVIHAIWNRASDTEVKSILGIAQNKDVPYRVKELRLLFGDGNSYKFYREPDGSVLFYFKP